MKTLALALALCLALALPATATDITAEDLTPLRGDKLRQAFSGVTMHGTYKRVRDISGTSNFTETFHTDGTTTYREGPILDKGEWAASDHAICFAYTGPLAGQFSCYNVFKAGNCYYSYATGALRDGYPVNPNGWSVKTITEGEHSTCDDLVS